MKIVTAKQMRAAEQQAVEHGTPESELMERAGRGVAEYIGQWLGSLQDRTILVLVGPGNNGGDGLVAASYLAEAGAAVQAYVWNRYRADDPLPKRARAAGVQLQHAENDVGQTLLRGLCRDATVVVDALLGTGRSRAIGGLLRDILRGLATVRRDKPTLRVVALDLPTGLDSDTGKLDPAAVAADLTLTLGFPKLGLFLPPGSEQAGEVVTLDIGLDENWVDSPMTLLTDGWVAAHLPARPRDGHKGTFGKVMVIAGSRNYSGAPVLAAAAAGRIGAGLVTIACPASIQPVVAARLWEPTFLPLPETASSRGYIGPEALAELVGPLRGYQAAVLGCGLSQQLPVARFVLQILREWPPEVGLVLDADGLNSLAAQERLRPNLPPRTVLTPHPAEMGRLLGRETAAVQRDRLEAARSAADQFGAVVALKGAHTLIAAPDGRLFVSTIATPALATAGTGDVLAGTIGGLLAQGMELAEAAALGVAVHGRAGLRVAARLGSAGAIAGDLPPELPLVLKALRGE